MEKEVKRNVVISNRGSARRKTPRVATYTGKPPGPQKVVKLNKNED